MSILRPLRALPAVPTGRAPSLLNRMRQRAGHDATFFTVRAKPQTDRRKPRM